MKAVQLVVSTMVLYTCGQGGENTAQVCLGFVHLTHYLTETAVYVENALEKNNC